MFCQHLTSINNINNNAVIVVVAGGSGNHYDILRAKIYCFLSVAIVVVVVVVIVCYYYYYYSSDFCNIVSNLQMDPAAAYRNGGVQNFFFSISIPETNFSGVGCLGRLKKTTRTQPTIYGL